MGQPLKQPDQGYVKNWSEPKVTKGCQSFTASQPWPSHLHRLPDQRPGLSGLKAEQSPFQWDKQLLKRLWWLLLNRHLSILSQKLGLEKLHRRSQPGVYSMMPHDLRRIKSRKVTSLPDSTQPGLSTETLLLTHSFHTAVFHGWLITISCFSHFLKWFWWGLFHLKKKVGWTQTCET